MKKILFLSLCLLVLAGCGDKVVAPNENQPPSNQESTQINKLQKDPYKLTNKIISLLANKQFDKLSKYVHPIEGVRFSPYTFVDKSQDLVFSPKQIKNAFGSGKQYLRGNYDGTGDPIMMSFSGYYDEFIYDMDYKNAFEIVYNEKRQRGNTINNVFDIYDGFVVEYYFPDCSKKYEGMNWKSLKLVYEKMNGLWYLVGVVHNQWTI